MSSEGFVWFFFIGFEKTLLAIFWNLIFLYKWPSERKKKEKPKILEMDSL